MFRHAAFAAILLASPLAFASGTRVSGGGHTIICPDQAPRFLDLYETEYVSLYAIDLPPDGVVTDPNLTVTAKALVMVDRLKKFSPLRHQWYAGQIQEFFGHISRFTSHDLDFINDSSYTMIPAGCTLEQLAIQKERGTPQDSSYYVNSTRWDALPLNDRAALLTHEIIYNEFLNYGHGDSVAARRLNGYLAGNRMQAFTLTRFLTMLHVLRVPDTDVGGIWLHVWDFTTDEDPYRSPKLELFENGLVKAVNAEAFANFESTPYVRANLFDHFRHYNPSYTVRGVRLKITAEHSSQRLPIRIELNRAQEVISVRVREDFATDATLWMEEPARGWKQVRRLAWDDAGSLKTIE